MENTVRVSEIMYSLDSTRNRRTILQLYNCTWLHHALCLKLFSSPCELSREKFFGTYLNDLSRHAGLQYEFACNEQILNAKTVWLGKADSHQNNQPMQNNVISEILLWLQMKQQKGKLRTSITPRQLKVSTVAKQVPEYLGTMVPTELIWKRKNSWQAHLKHLSNYLVLGPGIWWEAKDGAFYFKDGMRSSIQERRPTTSLPKFNTKRSSAEQDSFMEDHCKQPHTTSRLANHQLQHPWWTSWNMPPSNF